MKPYETKSHVMRGGRLVPKAKPTTLPLDDPIRRLREKQELDRWLDAQELRHGTQ